jgi:hypothetical protein
MLQTNFSYELLPKHRYFRAFRNIKFFFLYFDLIVSSNYSAHYKELLNIFFTGHILLS